MRTPNHQNGLAVDLSPERIEASLGEIDPVFLDTPQFVSARLSSALGREVLLKIETLNPIGSFKGRGTSVLARTLDPARTWVCATAGNFGQGLAYAARDGTRRHTSSWPLTRRRGRSSACRSSAPGWKCTSTPDRPLGSMPPRVGIAFRR